MIDSSLIESFNFFYEDLCIKSITSSVEHPQSNGQTEAANKVILNELKKRLDTGKGRWTEEMIEVLWAVFDLSLNQESLSVGLDLINEF